MATAKEKMKADKNKSQEMNGKMPHRKPSEKGPYRGGKKPGDGVKRK